MATNTIFLVRGDTTANWENKNPILKNREVAYDKTANRLKVGDGTTAWKSLPYVKPDVIDNFEDGGSDAALSAERGKELKALVDQKADITTVNSLKTDLINLINGSIPKPYDGLDNQNPNAFLSANQGYVLNQKIIDSKVTVSHSYADTSSTNALSAGAGYWLYKWLQDKANKSDLDNLKDTLTEVINNTVKEMHLVRLNYFDTNPVGGKKNNDKDHITTYPYKLTIPEGVNRITISGCGGGGGLGKLLGQLYSGWTGGCFKDLEVKVKAGDVLSLRPGVGGYGAYDDKGYRGSDSVVALNDTVIMRIAGGNGGSTSHAGNQNLDMFILDDADIIVRNSMICQISPSSASSYKLNDYVLDSDSVFINALGSPKSMFSPYGEGASFYGDSSEEGYPGLLIVEYVEPSKE